MDTDLRLLQPENAFCYAQAVGAAVYADLAQGGAAVKCVRFDRRAAAAVAGVVLNEERLESRAAGKQRAGHGRNAGGQLGIAELFAAGECALADVRNTFGNGYALYRRACKGIASDACAAGGDTYCRKSGAAAEALVADDPDALDALDIAQRGAAVERTVAKAL